MQMQEPDMPQLINDAVSLVDVEVTYEARQALIEQGESQSEHVAEELAQNRITHEFLVDVVRKVLEKAIEVAKEQGRYEVDENAVRESMARYCPYFGWC